MNPLPVFIAEDEPLARQRLAGFIAGVSWTSLVGEVGDGAAAVEGILRLRPAIVFLDIRMPELSGLDVVDRLRILDPAPAVVFTTAYDQYAVTAFELGAVDYLLKPFGEQRFITALQRARRVAQDHDGAAALQRARQALAMDAAAPVGHILVRDTAGAIVPLAPADIDHVQAQDDYSVLHAGGRQYLVGVPLQDLEVRLPCPPFLRIHRSFLVNLDYVERMIPSGDGRFTVKLRTGRTLPASRARSQEIRRLAR